MEKDRAAFIPHIVYLIYTIYELVIGICFQWPDWVITLILVGAISSMLFFIKKGRQHQGSRMHFASMIWMNLFFYSVYENTIITIIPMMAAAVLMLSLFDLIHIYYLSIGATSIIFLWNLFISKTFELSTAKGIALTLAEIFALYFVEILSVFQLKSRMKSEQKLEETMQSLKLAEQAKTDFMANVSHEIRTPLNTIYGIGSCLIEEQISDKAREEAYDILMAGRNLMSLVSDILDFSELENNSVEIIEDTYSMTSILNDVTNMVEAWNREKALEFILDCDGNLPSFLAGDSEKIYRIILNLMSNAVKFTEHGGILLRVETRKESYGVNLMVKIKDTGIGMTEEQVSNLNAIYNQADASKRRRESGIGLGIAISRMLIEKMGGFLHVSSQRNHGTTVSFVIPQKVVSDIPMVEVSQPAQYKVAYYFNLEKYGRSEIRDDFLTCISNIKKTLHLSMIRTSSIAELRQRIGLTKFTHVFTAEEEYEENPEFFHELSRELTVVVAVSRKKAMKRNAPAQMRFIYKPLHVFAVATVLNGDRMAGSVYGNPWRKDLFSARDAKVLVVDDNAMNHKVVDTLLRHYKIYVDMADSGKEAIERIKNKEYDLVFMDHMMPEMDGVEALHKIRQLPLDYAKEMPVVALTANAVSGARELFLREGFQDFVAKPIEKTSIERVLRKYLKDKLDFSVGEEEVLGTGLKKYENREENISSGDIVIKATVGKNKEGDFEEGSDKIAKLKQLPEMDTALGLTYFGGNREDYLEILESFCENFPEKYSEIKDAYEKEDWKNYVIFVHALKGASLTIGNRELSEKAKALEMAGREENLSFIHENHEEMLKGYYELTEKICEVLGITFSFSEGQKEAAAVREGVETSGEDVETIREGVETVRKGVEICREELQEKLERLIEKTESYEQEAVLAELESILEYSYHGQQLYALLGDVAKCVDDFDFESAGQLLQQIKEAL